MDMRDYIKARKEGLKAYSQALSKNENPYLPVLDEMIPNLNQLTHLPLGIITVPLENVIGSVSRGRSYAFANNFYPILAPGTEFAGKWAKLYESVSLEGLRDPAKVLEYMGNYYLIEGNKRASVMKFMGAEFLEVDCTRVYPERTNEPENIAYYEFCDFSRESGIYDIVFTLPGLYTKLTSLPGVKAGKAWTENEIQSLKKIYHYFMLAYRQLMREKECLPVANAFLVWLQGFGYEAVRDLDSESVLSKVRLMEKEFELHEEAVSLVMDHTHSAPSPSLLGSFFRPGKIKAAFLYTRDTRESSWSYWHEMGRLEAQHKLGNRVETISAVVPSRTETAETMHRLIQEGYTAIFATSPVMLNSLIEPSLEHPDVKLLCCSQLAGYNHVRTYYLRFYEAKFLLGMAAGILAKNGKIGYIGDYPICGVPASINAFAIGARMVNPKATVYLNWTSRSCFDPHQPFADPEIQVVCNRDLTGPQHGSRDAGLYIADQGEVLSMGALIPRWGVIYQHIIERIQNGSFDAGGSGSACLNYWWGMASDALDVAFSNRLDPWCQRLIRTLQEQLREMSFSPFEGELKDQGGLLRCEADQRLTPAEVLCADYLVDNVIGHLPELEELVEHAQPLVKLQGVHSLLKADASSINWTRD